MIPNVAPFFLPENKSYRDNRGEFIRIYDSNAENFGPQGENTLLQINVSVNPHQFTLRGMHFQIDGPRENKFIKVISGSIYLVVSNAHNMNRRSELNNYEYQIDANQKETLVVPSGWATGWLSLEEDTRILYMMTARFEECTYGGFRYNDPVALIKWPHEPSVISKKDENWEDLS